MVSTVQNEQQIGMCGWMEVNKSKINAHSRYIYFSDVIVLHDHDSLRPDG
jgi:hypothetical protein